MVAFRNLAVVAFAAVVAAQAGNQISDGQIQIQTSPIQLSTPVPSVTPVSVTPVSVTPVSVTPVPVSVTPVSVTPVPVSVTPVSVTPVAPVPSVTKVTLSTSPRPSASVSIHTSANGTFPAGLPSATPSQYKGAANVMAWGKEITVAAVGLAVGLALL